MTSAPLMRRDSITPLPNPWTPNSSSVCWRKKIRVSFFSPTHERCSSFLRLRHCTWHKRSVLGETSDAGARTYLFGIGSPPRGRIGGERGPPPPRTKLECGRRRVAVGRQCLSLAFERTALVG